MLNCQLSCLGPYTLLLHCSVCSCVHAPSVIVLCGSAEWSGFGSLLAVTIFMCFAQIAAVQAQSWRICCVLSLYITHLDLHIFMTASFGICSVDLPSYVAGSWLGMLPGTIAYVYAGNYGRALIDGDGDVGGVKGWQVALGLGITVLAVGYIGKLAKKALDDVEQEDGTSQSS